MSNVTLTWTSSKGDGIEVTYDIKRKLSTETDYKVISNDLKDTTYVDNNIDEGMIYSYIVIAKYNGKQKSSDEYYFQSVPTVDYVNSTFDGMNGTIMDKDITFPTGTKVGDFAVLIYSEPNGNTSFSSLSDDWTDINVPKGKLLTLDIKDDNILNKKYNLKLSNYNVIDYKLYIFRSLDGCTLTDIVDGSGGENKITFTNTDSNVGHVICVGFVNYNINNWSSYGSSKTLSGTIDYPKPKLNDRNGYTYLYSYVSREFVSYSSKPHKNIISCEYNNGKMVGYSFRVIPKIIKK